MPDIADIQTYLGEFAPLDLAEDWDNVGLLLGDPSRTVQRVMTCLTLTPDVADEAIGSEADLIVVHHPILFRAVKRLTTETSDGRMLTHLIRQGIGVYSPHTAFDNTVTGINAQLAERLQLAHIAPLRPTETMADNPNIGSGRVGQWETPKSWESFVAEVLNNLNLPSCSVVRTNRPIRKVAIACGAAGEFLHDAAKLQCDVFILGETRFHTALEARSLDIGLVILGHYASERFALETLATQLEQQFPELTVWASRVESDPLQLEFRAN